MLGNFHSILAFIGLVVFILIFFLIIFLVLFVKKSNEKSEANKLNNYKTQSEFEAQTRKNSTSKKADTE